MNWRIKAIIQKILSLSRFGDQMNHQLITFNKSYNKNVVVYQCHEALRKFSYTKLDLNNNLTALEIGTGYSLVSAVTLALLGFAKTITVDITADITFSSFKKQRNYFFDELFLEKIMEHSIYSRIELESKINSIISASSFTEVFKLLNIIYIAPYNFEDIEKEIMEIDYISSQVVLEHISPNILNTLFEKTKVWLSEGGSCIHTINFIDHFANPGIFHDKSISEFNFLRYSDSYWNSWAGNSIAYTNRLSHLFYLELCKKHNLKIVDFLGENYRNRVELEPSLIHDDIIKKYHPVPVLSELTKFQRGTLILKCFEEDTTVGFS